ncbi:MAG: hypothetical protein FJ399_07100 [Verrucomicrobia bacterium]|nr:hypothetical protein [Verrucomicrobiota bacterium]
MQKATAAGLKGIAVDDRCLGPDNRFMADVPSLGRSASQIGESVGAALFAEMTRQPAVKRWLICALNDPGVLGAVRATDGRGFPAEPVIGIGINGTDCIDELRQARPTGFHGSMFVSAPGRGLSHRRAAVILDQGRQAAAPRHAHHRDLHHSR